MKGLDKVKSKLKALPEDMEKAGAQGLRQVGDLIYSDSQGQVPVDTGYLKASGTITESGSGKGIKIVISYSADYAVYVHEVLGNYHANGNAKYLENPFTRYSGSVDTFVASYLKRVI